MFCSMVLHLRLEVTIEARITKGLIGLSLGAGATEDLAMVACLVSVGLWLL